MQLFKLFTYCFYYATIQSMEKKIKIGLIGLGTVGSGVFKTLQNFKNVEVVKIAVRNKNKKRNIEGLDESIITDNAYEIVNDPEIDIVAELVGGVEPAFDLIKTAIKNGKHIVTANKELLAKHGEELFNFAETNNKVVLYEAAIAGGIPLIMPIKTILAGNKISKIKAILNGTTNYILTKMDVQGASYADVLDEAQKLGYAEADPTGDVEGFDAAYKITTLATIAFGKRIKIENVYREGITKISPDDMKAIAGGESGIEAVGAVGVSVAFEIAGVILGNYERCQNDVFSFLASLSGMDIKQIESLPLDTFTEMVIDVVKKEDFKNFMKVVSKLFK